MFIAAREGAREPPADVHAGAPGAGQREVVEQAGQADEQGERERASPRTNRTRAAAGGGDEAERRERPCGRGRRRRCDGPGRRRRSPR